MAHCSSSLPFVSHNNAHDENLQELLPLRKRLLLALRHAIAISAETPSMPPPPPEPPHMKKVQGDVAASRPPPSLLMPNHSQNCFTCGDGDAVLLRVPYLAGSSGYHCSSCILEMNKQMYCVQCYDVLDEDSPTTSSRASDLLTCCRCERRTHFHCALKLWSPSLEGVGLTLCKDCHMMSNGQFADFNTAQEHPGGQRFKESFVTAGKVKLPFVEAKELVAARIVALTAKKAALNARQKAKFLAKAAAVTAVHAKAALDCIYDLGQKEADVAENGEPNDEVAITANRNLKSLKQRALSSIVASEVSSKRDGHMVNHIDSPDHLEFEQERMSSDFESAEAASPSHGLGPEPGPCVTQKGRLAVKRRKSLSSLGGQNSTNSLSTRNRSKIANKKIRKPRFLTKGNLGAIMSQVLASNKSSMSTSKTPYWKGKVGGSHCSTWDISSENGV